MMAAKAKKLKELQDALLTLKEIHIFLESDHYNVVLQGEMTVCKEMGCITRGSRVHSRL